MPSEIINLHSYKFGFLYNKKEEKLNFGTLDWYDKKIIQNKINYKLSSFFKNKKNKHLIPLYPASLYYIWKNIIWTNKYYKNFINSADNIKNIKYRGNDRFTNKFGTKNEIYILIKNSLIILINKITIIFKRKIILVYLISDKPSSLINTSIENDLKNKKNKIIFIKKFTKKSLIHWLKKRDTIFIFDQNNIVKNNYRKELTNYLEFLSRESSYFKELLKSKVELFYGEDDPSRIFSLLFAMKRLSVQTVGFQHGLYSDHEIGYSVRLNSDYLNGLYWWFDNLYVIDKNWLKIIKNLQNINQKTKFFAYSDKEIKKDNLLKFSHTSKLCKKIIIVMDCYADVYAYKELFKFLKKKNVLEKCFLRPHPSMNREEIEIVSKKIFKIKKNNYELTKDNIYICFKSTLAIELIKKDIRVYFFKNKLNFLENYIEEVFSKNIPYLNNL